MTYKWCSDSCDCQIEVDGNFAYVNWIQKCFIHKNMNDTAFVNVVQLLNNNLNRAARTEPEKIQDKANEKARIRALGEPIKNPNWSI